MTNHTHRRPTSRRRALLVGGASISTALVLAACGVGEPVDNDTADNGAAEQEGGAGGGGEDAEVTFRFAHVYDASHPVETCGVPAIQDALQGSGVAIESYPAAQLGSEAESLEQIAGGGLDIAVAGPSFLGVWYEDAAVLDGAYLFEDVDHFTEAVESEQIGEIHDALYEESGIDVTSTWYYGTRHITSNVPISGPDDLAGIKIRTPDAPLYLTNIEAMGGTATPMALDEVYTGLQQGALDAQENPIPTINSSNFHEVQDYINLSGHMVQAVHVVTHDGVYDAMSEEQRTQLEDAMAAGGDAVMDCIITQEEEVLAEWQESGVIEVNEDVDKEAFASQVAERLPDEVPWGDLYLEIQGSR